MFGDGGVLECRTLKSRLPVYIYTGCLDLRVLLSAPPFRTHTSDRPIFKIPFDSEHLGKFMRHYQAFLLIFAFDDPLKYNHMFWYH